MIEMNKNVPVEYTLKIAYKSLKEENTKLKNKLGYYEQTIKRFKDWQRNVTKYHVSHWINTMLTSLNISLDQDTKDIIKKLKEIQKELNWKTKYQEMKKSRDAILSNYNSLINKQ